jgi:hypothetical protein
MSLCSRLIFVGIFSRALCTDLRSGRTKSIAERKLSMKGAPNASTGTMGTGFVNCSVLVLCDKPPSAFHKRREPFHLPPAC